MEITSDSDFIASLALHSHRRDTALGLGMSRRTRGLLWFYGVVLSRELKDVMWRSYWVGVLEGCKQRMAEIMAIAPGSDEEAQKRLVGEAQILQGQAERAARAINGERESIPSQFAPIGGNDAIG